MAAKRINRRFGTYIRGSKMTLIIGARFRDGVILISDRKVTEFNSGKHTFEKKLQTPLNFSVVFGAAGYSHKFKQFNRMILDLVDQRIREFKVKNISYYKQNDIEYEEPTQVETKIEKLTTKEIENEGSKEEEAVTAIQTPDVFIYTHELFIKDCSDLTRQLCIGKDGIARPDLDVLLGIHSRDRARIHHLDYLGEEQEVDFCAIGSGAAYVEIFLRKFWREEMSIEQIISLCFFCIFYVQDLNLEDGVGVEINSLPDHQVVTNDGVLGVWTEIEKNKAVILNDVQKKILGFKKQVDSLSF